MIIRFANSEDPTEVAQIVDIYAPFVLGSPATFETKVPSVAEMAERIEKVRFTHPWLVAVSGENQGHRILGYAYAGPHRTREAYQWCVESSAYLHESARRQGLGGRLYQVLFAILRQQGFANVYAGITSPNPMSENFHQRFGFQKIAHYSQIGFKLDRWHDVSWWAYSLGEKSAAPVPPKPLARADWPADLAQLIYG